jgi:hypothetical protein
VRAVGFVEGAFVLGMALGRGSWEACGLLYGERILLFLKKKKQKDFCFCAG